MKRNNNSDSVNDLFKLILIQNGTWNKYLEQKIINNWKSIVGVKIAASTTHISFSNRKLFLRIDSSVLRSEMLSLRSNLVDIVNSKAGEPIIDDVVIR